MLNIIYTGHREHMSQSTKRRKEGKRRNFCCVERLHFIASSRIFQKKEASILIIVWKGTYIELADIFEVLVECFDHVVDELQHRQLVDVLLHVDSDNEVQRRIPSVDHLVLPMLQERTL